MFLERKFNLQVVAVEVWTRKVALYRINRKEKLAGGKVRRM
jgi:hypothetical protein